MKDLPLGEKILCTLLVILALGVIIPLFLMLMLIVFSFIWIVNIYIWDFLFVSGGDSMLWITLFLSMFEFATIMEMVFEGKKK